MRLAVSAVTGLSGLVLLGLAIYGQPAIYVHEVREHLAGWFTEEREAYFPRHPAQDEKLVERMTSLQKQVVALQAELAQRQAAQGSAATATPSSPAASTGPLIPPLPAGGPPSSATAIAPPLSQGGSASPPAGASSSNRGADPAPSIPGRGLQGAAATALAPGNAGSAGPAGQPQGADTAAQMPIPVPERRDVATARPPRRPFTTPEAEVFSPDPSASKPAPKSAHAAPAKHAETDDPQSVLARLRQSGSPPPVPPRAENAAAAPSPALPRLTSARAALNAGRTDDAVRLLQEAQLQLVFRPVDAPGGDPEAAGQGAADVARALEALSANNLPASLRYVDRALADISVNRTNSSAGRDAPPVLGYAPVSPSR